MIKRAQIEDGDIAKSWTGLLRSALERGVVDMLLVPQCTPEKNSLTYSLICDAERIQPMNPFTPVMPQNLAAMVASLTRQDTQRRFGVIARSCEIRASIELAKFQQARLDAVVFFGLECRGVVPSSDYAKAAEDVRQALPFVPGKDPAADSSCMDVDVRSSCCLCEAWLPEQADILITCSREARQEYLLCSSQSDKGAQVLEQLDLEEGAIPDSLAEERKAWEAKRREEAARILQETKEYASPLIAVSELSRCILCRNCQQVCPLCYCTECVFDTPLFRHPSEKWVQWAEKMGAVSMPKDVLLFHATRMSHMATSCVGCGQCEDACPRDIPLGSLFPVVARRAQALFGYAAGRDEDEEPPLMTFKEEELSPL